MSDEDKRTRSGLHEIQWTNEIPPKPPSRHLYAQQEEQLREKPGKWALIAQCPSKVAAYGAGFARKKKWGEEFEIAVRGQEVYARFNGAGSTRSKRSSVKAARRSGKRKAKAKRAVPATKTES
jgi:hypothetical protein